MKKRRKFILNNHLIWPQLEQLQCTHSLPIFSLHGQYLRIENKKHNSNATPYPSFILGERKFNPLFEGWKSKTLYSPCHHQLIYPLVFLSFATAISLSISVAYVNLKYRGSIKGIPLEQNNFLIPYILGNHYYIIF